MKFYSSLFLFLTCLLIIEYNLFTKQLRDPLNQTKIGHNYDSLKNAFMISADSIQSPWNNNYQSDSVDYVIQSIYLLGKILQMQESLTDSVTFITNNLEVIEPEDKTFSIFNFSYPSGGTAGDINNNFLRYVKNDSSIELIYLGKFPKEGSWFFNDDSSYDDDNLEIPPNTVSSGAEFGKIYKLRTNSLSHKLYLAIGEGKGNTSFGIYDALVIEIKDDSLRLDYPAFADSTAFLDMFCPYGDVLKYKPEQQTLVIDLSDADEETNEKWNYFFYKKENLETFNHIINLKFNGNKFVVKK